jgi:SsrA-binding protein
MSEKNTNGTRTILVNRKAYHDFSVIQTVEAGISLSGTEVKSAKDGKVSFRDGFCFIKEGEIFLKNVHISRYPYGNRINHDPDRDRKLLLHKREIARLNSKVREKGLTIVPLRMYEKHGMVKLEIGLVKGKRLYDKKEDIRARDQMRDLKRSFKLSNFSGKLK